MIFGYRGLRAPRLSGGGRVGEEISQYFALAKRVDAAAPGPDVESRDAAGGTVCGLGAAARPLKAARDFVRDDGSVRARSRDAGRRRDSADIESRRGRGRPDVRRGASLVRTRGANSNL